MPDLLFSPQSMHEKPLQPEDLSWEAAQKQIKETLEKAEITLEADRSADLRHLSPEAAMQILHSITELGTVVLHGTNAKEQIRQLQPRQANDTAKVSGNLTAVYATVHPEVAVMRAILNKKYIAERLGESFIFGERITTNVDDTTGQEMVDITFNASANLHELFKQQDPNIVSDGYIYALNRSQFTKSPESRSEHFSLQEQRPVTIFRVSSNLGSLLFRMRTAGNKDTVIQI